MSRTRLKTPLTYIEHDHIPNWKFSEHFEKHWPQKWSIYQNITQFQFLLHFSDYRRLHFSFNIIRSVYRISPIFYWRKKLVHANLPNTLNIVVKSKEKFLEVHLKKRCIFLKNTIRRSFNTILRDMLLHFSQLV